jgi:predicted RNA binding protein YcfA (HicA-like mRNA interferase family)
MSQWGSCKSRVLLRALNRIGWTLKRDAKGSHRILAKEGWPDVIFAFHDGEEVGPRMLARIAKQTGLKPEDL